MITKEQAFEALNRVQNGTSDGWESFDVVRRYIQQSPRVPEKISDYGYPDYGEVWGYYMEGWNDCIDEILSTVPKPESKWQYYYRTNTCPAKNSTDPNCVCWHDEGTGPYKDQRHDDLTPLVRWRTKPGADDE